MNFSIEVPDPIARQFHLPPPLTPVSELSRAAKKAIS